MRYRSRRCSRLLRFAPSPLRGGFAGLDTVSASRPSQLGPRLNPPWAATTIKHPGQRSIAYWDMVAILTRAQSGNRCPANTNANVCFKCLCGKDIESETTQTECPCLDEKEAVRTGARIRSRGVAPPSVRLISKMENAKEDNAESRQWIRDNAPALMSLGLQGFAW
jgi:hypothetical protein